jgi:hypothetical protein
MTRKTSLFLTVAMLVVLLVGAVGVYAQGPGGNGNRGPNSNQCINNPADCEQNQNQQQNQQGNQDQQRNQNQNQDGTGTCPMCDPQGNQNQNQQGNTNQNGPMGQQMGNGPVMRQGSNASHLRVGAYAVWANEPVETVDEALSLADEYVDDMYTVGEVIELETMYYIPIYEGTTPVFELWINKDTGFIMGMQMNQYGYRFMADDSVQILLDEALVTATEALEANQVLGDVIVFDDHYTFPVLENGVIVALLKVSAHSGNLFWYQ